MSVNPLLSISPIANTLLAIEKKASYGENFQHTNLCLDTQNAVLHRSPAKPLYGSPATVLRAFQARHIKTLTSVSRHFSIEKPGIEREGLYLELRADNYTESMK